MSVSEVKELCQTAETPRLLRLYQDMKSKQKAMSLSKLIASCRVTDKLHSELKRRSAI
jgi:hypothetical protein